MATDIPTQPKIKKTWAELAEEEEMELEAMNQLNQIQTQYENLQSPGKPLTHYQNRQIDIINKCINKVEFGIKQCPKNVLTRDIVTALKGTIAFSKQARNKQQRSSAGIVFKQKQSNLTYRQYCYQLEGTDYN